MQRVAAIFGAVGVWLFVWSSPALAWTAEVGWPTFYRDGPDRRYTVLDELDRGEKVDVVSCDDTWCKVISKQKTGYVEKANLYAPEAVPNKPAVQPASDACFEAQQSGYDKGETWRYCRKP